MVYDMRGAFGSYRIAQFFNYARWAREDIKNGYINRYEGDN